MTTRIDRMALAPFAKRSASYSLVLLAMDLSAYGACVVGTIAAHAVWLKLLFAVGAGTMIALTAIVGHDAGHQSFSRSKLLNRICGTIAFLPALHPFCLWEHHHNRVHHRFTAQLGVDNAFPPMTPEQYRNATAFTRARYRFMRSLWGQPFFYLVEIWLPDMWLPFLKQGAAMTTRAWFDLAVVYVWLAAFLGATTWLSMMLSGTSLPAAMLDAFLFAFLIPFLVWNTFISFLSIVQHTSPGVRWIQPTGAPSTVEQAMAGTVHVVLPEYLDRLFHRIMQHQAHHVHVGIPLQELKAAQSGVAEANEGRLVIVWTPAYHLAITRACKLYDVNRQRWCTFAEAYETEPSMELAA